MASILKNNVSGCCRDLKGSHFLSPSSATSIDLFPIHREEIFKLIQMIFRGNHLLTNSQIFLPITTQKLQERLDLLWGGHQKH